MLEGRKMVGNGSMEVYVEQPTCLRDALNQRKRWTVGDMQCLRTYFRPVLRAIPQGGIRIVKALIDLLMVTALIGFSAGVFFLILYAILADFPVVNILFTMAVFIGVYWIFMAIHSLVMFYKENMRIRDNLATLTLFPFWILISTIFAIYGLFVRDTEWGENSRRGVSM